MSAAAAVVTEGGPQPVFTAPHLPARIVAVADVVGVILSFATIRDAVAFLRTCFRAVEPAREAIATHVQVVPLLKALCNPAFPTAYTKDRRYWSKAMLEEDGSEDYDDDGNELVKPDDDGHGNRIVNWEEEAATNTIGPNCFVLEERESVLQKPPPFAALGPVGALRALRERVVALASADPDAAAMVMLNECLRCPVARGYAVAGSLTAVKYRSAGGTPATSMTMVSRGPASVVDTKSVPSFALLPSKGGATVVKVGWGFLVPPGRYVARVVLGVNSQFDPTAAGKLHFSIFIGVYPRTGPTHPRYGGDESVKSTTVDLATVFRPKGGATASVTRGGALTQRVVSAGVFDTASVLRVALVCFSQIEGPTIATKPPIVSGLAFGDSFLVPTVWMPTPIVMAPPPPATSTVVELPAVKGAAPKVAPGKIATAKSTVRPAPKPVPKLSVLPAKPVAMRK